MMPPPGFVCAAASTFRPGARRFRRAGRALVECGRVDAQRVGRHVRPHGADPGRILLDDFPHMRGDQDAAAALAEAPGKLGGDDALAGTGRQIDERIAAACAPVPERREHRLLLIRTQHDLDHDASSRCSFGSVDTSEVR
jgi:hypothetical protein